MRLQGWVRTRRDSKGGFSFIELNDGSCQGNVQVVAPGELAELRERWSRTSTPGRASSIDGEVKASPAKGQATEVLATPRRAASATPTPRRYPLQKKGHTLRVPAHHRPPAAADQHVRRDRPAPASGVDVDPRVLPRARLPLHPHADHHRQRLRRGRRAVPRHDARPREAPPKAEGKVDYTKDFFDKPAYLTVSGQLQVEIVRVRARQGLHLRPDVPRRELEHPAAPRRVLDDRAGDGLLRPDRQHGPRRGVPQADHRRRARRTAPKT